MTDNLSEFGEHFEVAIVNVSLTSEDEIVDLSHEERRRINIDDHFRVFILDRKYGAVTLSGATCLV